MDGTRSSVRAAEPRALTAAGFRVSPAGLLALRQRGRPAAQGSHPGVLQSLVGCRVDLGHAARTGQLRRIPRGVPGRWQYADRISGHQAGVLQGNDRRVGAGLGVEIASTTVLSDMTKLLSR